MGKAVPEQHPAVVLRSHYNHLRALLIAALIAVLGLAGAVVIVANDDDTVVSTSTPAIESGATGVPNTAPRYDGGPNEGSADITPGVNLPARPNQAQAFPGTVPAGRGRRESPRHSHGPATAAGRRCHEPGQRRRDDRQAGRDAADRQPPLRRWPERGQRRHPVPWQQGVREPADRQPPLRRRPRRGPRRRERPSTSSSRSAPVAPQTGSPR